MANRNCGRRSAAASKPTDHFLSTKCLLVILLTASSVILSVAAAEQPAESKAPASAPVDSLASAKSESVAPKEKEAPADVESTRKARADQPAPAAAAAESDKVGKSAAAPSKSAAELKAKQEPDAASKATASSAPAATTTSKPAAQESASSQKATPTSKSRAAANSAANKSSSSLKRANLGTVTSTGSGGPAHYMSKHDAYSAIAEKHGALAQDAVHRRSDKRHHHQPLQRLGGIQKASGFGDMLAGAAPFKGMGDSGLARTLGASMRSIIKGKYSVPAYLASAVIGAVALMAFYESPISPLPVPALPEPPVGRFPPEMPNLSPNIQVPFRTNPQFGPQPQQQQQMYGGNQRSLQVGQPQQQQQVLFPGQQPAAQQRQATDGPVQQLAANLFSSVSNSIKPLAAQRKSGIDYADQQSAFSASQRSFLSAPFGANPMPGQAKLSAPANQQQAQKQGSSFLSYFGLGGAQSPQTPMLGDIQQAAGPIGSQQVGAASDAKATTAAALSNSHVVNKVKSYFSRSGASAPSSSPAGLSSAAGANPYDQYHRMSLVQALMKDTAFLPGFLTPSRKSSTSAGASAPAQSMPNRLQQSINNVLSAVQSGGGAAPVPQQAASRMQADTPSLLMIPHQQQQAPVAQPDNNKRATSGFGLMRAADRIAHALLDTFTSGLTHRSSQAAASQQQRSEQQQQQATATANAIASATSILSDIVSNYNQQQAAPAPVGHQEQQMDLSAKSQAQQQQSQSALPSNQQKQQQPDFVSSRSDETHEQSAPPAPVAAASDSDQKPQKSQPQAAPVNPTDSSASSQQQQLPALSRKTRSIGLEYPVEYVAREQPQPQLPSKATQINNFVDFVSDSYNQNRLLFKFVMNQVGLSQAVPYVEQILSNNGPSELYH